MDPLLIVFLVCMVLGAMVGFLAGLLGIGGGLIIVPALLYMLQSLLGLDVSVAMPMAIATSLSTILFTGLSSAASHYRLGNIHVPQVISIAPGIAVGAILGAQVAVFIDGDLLKNVFAVLVILIALRTFFAKETGIKKQVSVWHFFIVGSIAGLLSALMGIGGGALLVPALVWLGVPLKRAIGAAAACGIVIAVFGSASFIHAGWTLDTLPYWSFGYVFLPASLGIVVTSVFTANIGAKFTSRLDTNQLKKVFSLFLLIVSLRMLLS